MSLCNVLPGCLAEIIVNGIDEDVVQLRIQAVVRIAALCKKFFELQKIKIRQNLKIFPPCMINTGLSL